MQSSENKKTIAFIFKCNVEYKSLLLSGLYNKLKMHHHVIGIMQDCPSVYLDEYIDSYELEYFKFDEQYYQHETLKIESIASASRKARNRIKKIGNFGYFKQDRKVKWFDYVIGNYFCFTILQFLTLRKIKKHYKRNDVIRTYRDLGVTDIILCGYSAVTNKLFAINAIQEGIDVWITLNNWKDIYVDGFIPFKPSGIFAWNNEMKEEYLKRNSHISSGLFDVTGNPAFDRFYNFQPTQTRKYYESKYEIGQSQPILLYTLLAPDTYEHELESIKLISELLKKIYKDPIRRPLLLLRRNPLDMINLMKTRLDENVIFADHYFEGNKDKGIIIQSQEGEDEWLDLIHYSEVVLNVASTVTLEALMLETPTINIEFNGLGENEELLKRFTEAPFYSPLLGREDVIICQTIKDCKDALTYFLERNKCNTATPTLIGAFDGQASSRMIDVINLKDKR